MKKLILLLISFAFIVSSCAVNPGTISSDNDYEEFKSVDFGQMEMKVPKDWEEYNFENQNITLFFPDETNPDDNVTIQKIALNDQQMQLYSNGYYLSVLNTWMDLVRTAANISNLKEEETEVSTVPAIMYTCQELTKDIVYDKTSYVFILEESKEMVILSCYSSKGTSSEPFITFPKIVSSIRLDDTNN